MSDAGREQKKGRKKAKRQRRERGRLHLSVAPSGIWYMRGTVANKEVYKSTGTHSEEHAARIRDEYERQLLDEAVYGKKAVATFSDAVASYYKRVSTTNAWSRYLPEIEKHIGHVKLSEITAERVYNLADELCPKCKNSSKNTMVIAPTVGILRHAARMEMCDVKLIKQLPNDAKRVAGASPEWIATALSNTDDRFKRARVLLALLTTTGCRGIDAVRLLWDNVDLDKGTAFLPITKNGDPRTLVLTGALVQMIRDLPRVGPKVLNWNSTSAATEGLYALADACGLPRMSCHKVGRHAFAERMLNEGYTLKQVQQMGGWRDIQVLSRNYGHLEQSKLDEAVREQAANVLAPKLKVVNGGKD